MGRAYRSAQGQAIDMDRVKLQNEKTIAVGNMKVNARGDQLGPGGAIAQPKNQVAAQNYKLNTPIAREQRVHETTQTQQAAGAKVNQGRVTEQPPIPEVDPSGVPFDEPEQIVEQPTQQMRGSLADSIAKQVTIEQQTLDPNMYKNLGKPKGPQRI